MADFNRYLNQIKSFDWRSLQRLTTPHAAGDLNAFLEKLPQNAGNTILIMAGIAWAAAGASGLYVTLQMKELVKLRADLQTAKAVKPTVPAIKDVPVDTKEIEDFVSKIEKIYEGVSIKANGSSILITAENTAAFGQFREAMGHVQNGGAGWRVGIERLCVGRECERQPLAASLSVNKVSVENP